MACTYQLRHPEFDLIDVYESHNCRRITLRVTAQRKVRISAPPRVSMSTLKQFIAQNEPWIRETLQRIDSQQPKPLLFVPSLHFETREHELVFHQIDPQDKRVGVGVTGPRGSSKAQIIVNYHAEADLAQPVFQQLIHNAIDFALKCEARRILPKMINDVAQRTGLTYSSLALRNMTTQWGNCSSTGRICLNIQLMRLPDHLIEHVIVHELCHTLEHNHSQRFWEHVDHFSNGKAKQLNAELKKYHTNY